MKLWPSPRSKVQSLRACTTFPSVCETPRKTCCEYTCNSASTFGGSLTATQAGEKTRKRKHNLLVRDIGLIGLWDRISSRVWG